MKRWSSKDDLEKRVDEFDKFFIQLATVEDELRELKDSKKEDENGASLKADLDEAKDELKVLKRAYNTGTKDAQKVHEVKSKDDELLKEIVRLSSVANVNQRCGCSKNWIGFHVQGNLSYSGESGLNQDQGRQGQVDRTLRDDITSPTLETDDGKTDASLIRGDPCN